MDPLFEHLRALNERPLGAIVVLGAGGGRAIDPERLAALGPKRLVLVEGDPDHAAELQRQVGGLACAEVRAQVVAAQAGPLPWRRYSVPALNGPVDATPLQGYYPRLQQTVVRELAAAALAPLLKGLGLAEHTNVLLIDLPGQEDDLIASIPTERLYVFEVIGVRGCRETLNLSPPPVNGLGRLQKLAYRRTLVDDRSQPLWPLTLLRFDAQRHRLQMLERDLAAARDAERQAQARVSELEARNAELQDKSRNAERDAARLAQRDVELADAVERAKKVQLSLDRARAESEETRAALERRALAAESALESAVAKAASLEEQVRELQAAQARQALRQQLLQDEMHRAEGQIELVKSMLLGNDGL